MKISISFLLVTLFVAANDCLAWGGSVSFEAETPIVVTRVRTPTDGGIREDVPGRLKAKFAKWKAELLATEFGRDQWEAYANNRHFLLIIKVTGERGKGAGTDKFQWDDDGNLVGATIMLGTQLDEGFPGPVYYPVLNAMSPDVDSKPISSAIIAAAKLSHELGHVDQTARMSEKLIELQRRLIPQYVEIFLKNGRNPTDERLLDMQEKMGGTPTGIWEDREYWSEVDTARYLTQRLSDESNLCRVLRKTKRNLADYAPSFQARFNDRPEIASLACWN